MTTSQRPSDPVSAFDLGELRKWSEAKKCFWGSLIVAAMVAWYAAVARYLQTHPQTAPYVDRAVLDGWLMPFVLAALASWVSMVLAAAWAWRKGSESKALSFTLVQLYASEIGVFGYMLGSHTSPVLAVAIITGVALGALLWDRRMVLSGVVTIVAITAATTVAAQIGVVPYAPLLAASPVERGHLDPAWFAGFGGVTLFVAAMAVTLVHATMAATRRSEQALVRRTDELSRARAELEGARSRLIGLTENLRTAQSHLVQAEKMASLGQLVAGIAHELNNPASFVHGALANLAEFSGAFTEAIRTFDRCAERDPGLREVLAPARERLRLERLLRETPEVFAICSEGSERIRDLVADLRSFSRGGSGVLVSTDVRAGIESTLRLLHARSAAVGVSIRVDGESPPIQGDPAQLNQVWMNLLGNALDAVEGRAHPEIVVSFSSSDDRLEVRIADNGPGVDPAVRGRAFEPFVTTKGVGRGTGLGLGISSSIVRQHGGVITLEDNPTGGALVRVRFPSGTGPKGAARDGGGLG